MKEERSTIEAIAQNDELKMKLNNYRAESVTVYKIFHQVDCINRLEILRCRSQEQDMELELLVKPAIE